MKDSTGEKSAQREAQTPGAIYRCRVAFRPIYDFEVSGGMRATQRVAEVTWTGYGGGEGDGGDPGRRAESGEELFFVFYQKRRPFFKPGSVRAVVAASVVVHRSRQWRYEY